jgi:thiosulfate/3-mercaptopyruvate sulfurtransferase
VHTTIVEPATLLEHLGDPNWVIIDCRHTLADFSAGRRAYDEAHIPGAFFADVENDLTGRKHAKSGRHPMPERDRFVDFLRELGVNDDTQVVAYDAGADMFAARPWHLARWIGHNAVAILDGGWSAWVAAGYPVTAEIPERPRPGKIAVRAERVAALDADAVHKSLDAREHTLLDARGAERYAGEQEPIDPVAGHIPGARNRWFKDNFEDGRLKSPEQLRSEFASFGEPHRIVHYCGSGVSAAVNVLAMEHAGMSGSKIFAGSWSEWITDPSRPIATGRD